jgi:hypothetical protein
VWLLHTSCLNLSPYRCNRIFMAQCRTLVANKASYLYLTVHKHDTIMVENQTVFLAWCGLELHLSLTQSAPSDNQMSKSRIDSGHKLKRDSVVKHHSTSKVFY